MTDEQGDQHADQQERSAGDRAPTEPGSATSDSSARGEQSGRPAAGEGGGDDPPASGPAGAFFAAQSELTGRPVAELAAESARRHTGGEDEQVPGEPGDFVDGEGRRSQARHVGTKAGAAAPAGYRPPRLDPASAVALNEANVRRCGFSRCRKVLPDERRPGKKSEYCAKEVTSWEAEPGVVKTCGQMARAERDLAAVVRLQTGVEADGTVGVPGLNVVELGDRIDIAILAVQSALGPVTRLLEDLAGVRAQLDQDVTAAHAARDEALNTKTVAESDASAARQVAVDAEAAQSAAEERTEVAERAARSDRLAKETAERAKATAEGQVSELRDNLVRADERIEALVERADKAADNLSRAAGERDAARAAIAEEKQRADDQEQRANNTVAAAAELERTLRAEFADDQEQRARDHQQALVEARTGYDNRVAQARREFDAAVEQVREQAESARQTDRAAHAEQLRALDRQLGGLTQRAETAEGKQGGLVWELRAALVQALALAGEVDVEDRPGRAGELRGEVGRLLVDE